MRPQHAASRTMGRTGLEACPAMTRIPLPSMQIRLSREPGLTFSPESRKVVSHFPLPERYYKKPAKIEA